MPRRPQHSPLGAALAVAVALVSVIAGLGAPPAPAVPSAPVTAARATGSTFALGDPDTVRAEDGRYVTYGTTVPAGRGDRCTPAGRGRLWVPVLVHGRGTDVGLTDCASRDALPSGPGTWARSDKALWAPGVARWRGRFYLYYSAVKKGTERRCLGLAVSRSAYGPFRHRGTFTCGSRWSLDANPFVARRSLFVAYRDDGATSSPESAISVVRTDRTGHALPRTRRTVLTSADVRWDTVRSDGEAHIVENPSVFGSRGHWYLAFSGNQWASPRYATGIADCGEDPLPARRCRPIRGGADRPYFGFTGAAGLDPVRGMPGNHRGPGALDVFSVPDGSLRVVWHWYDARTELRHPVTGTLTRNRSGFHVR